MLSFISPTLLSANEYSLKVFLQYAIFSSVPLLLFSLLERASRQCSILVGLISSKRKSVPVIGFYNSGILT